VAGRGTQPLGGTTVRAEAMVTVAFVGIGWAVENGRGGAHWGGRVSCGTWPQLHGGEVPSVAGSVQGVERARRALRGVIWAEVDGVLGSSEGGAVGQ
jgi:hypothetical protein